MDLIYGFVPNIDGKLDGRVRSLTRDRQMGDRLLNRNWVLKKGPDCIEKVRANLKSTPFQGGYDGVAHTLYEMKI